MLTHLLKEKEQYFKCSKKMSVADLRKKVDIAPNTMIRLKRDQEVTMYLLERICDELDVGVDDTLEHTPEKKRVIERDDF